MRISEYIDLLGNGMRLSNPMSFKAPVLITVPYIFVFTGSISIIPAIFYILLSGITIFGISGVGYFINDFHDKKDDAITNKRNIFNQSTKSQQLVLLICVIIAAIGPWFIFPVTPVILGLLTTEILLFYMYSSKPFRLKDRKLLGVITDSIYAHTLPSLIAALTFIQISPDSISTHTFIILLSLILWQFLLGLRNVILHQLDDHDHDVKSETTTFVVSFGKNESWLLLKWIIIPIEILLFILFIFKLSEITMVFWVFIITYLLFLISSKKKYANASANEPIRYFSYRFLDEYYINWYPICILSLFILTRIEFALLFVFHIIAFPSGLLFIRDKIYHLIRNRIFRLKNDSY